MGYAPALGILKHLIILNILALCLKIIWQVELGRAVCKKYTACWRLQKVKCVIQKQQEEAEFVIKLIR